MKPEIAKKQIYLSRNDPLYKFVGIFGDVEVPEDFTSDIDKYIYGGEDG